MTITVRHAGRDLELSDDEVAAFHRRVAAGNPGACWPWQGQKTVKGYGRFTLSRHESPIQVRAHRISWCLANRPLGDDEVIRHSCDSPSCCNPAHLLVGSHLQNTADKMQRRRWKSSPIDVELHQGRMDAIEPLRQQGKSWAVVAAALGYPSGSTAAAAYRRACRLLERTADVATMQPATSPYVLEDRRQIIELMLSKGRTWSHIADVFRFNTPASARVMYDQACALAQPAGSQ